MLGIANAIENATTTTTLPGDLAISTTSTNPDPPFDPTPGDVVSVTTTTLPTEAQPGVTTADVHIRGVEVTQGIQDLHSRMPLVAGRRTTVRVHVGVDNAPLHEVDGVLIVQRPGQTDEVLTPDNGPIGQPFERTDLDGALNVTLGVNEPARRELSRSVQQWRHELARLPRQRTRGRGRGPEPSL